MVEDFTLTRNDLMALNEYLVVNHVELLVSDFNGVLDNYYQLKYRHLMKLLGEGNRAHFVDLALFTDTEYQVNRAASLEQSISKYFAKHNLPLDAQLLASGMGEPQLTESAKQFLKNLEIPYIIYTAQPLETVARYREVFAGDWISCEELGEPKPSANNLRTIRERYLVNPEHVCVVGDGLIDDLMPAHLLGMQTVLVSPFATHSLRFSKNAIDSR